MPTLRRAIWSVTLSYWAVLFVLTPLPPNRVPDTGISDKVEHLLAYGLLGALIFLSLQFRRPAHGAVAWQVIAIGLAYGAIDEWSQPPFGRTCDLKDWLADAAGILVASIGTALLVRVLPAAVFGRSEAGEKY